MNAIFSALVVFMVLLTSTAWCDPVYVKRTLTEENVPREGKTYVLDILLRIDGMIELGWAVANQRPSASRNIFILSASHIPEMESLLKKSVEWLKIAREKDVLSFDKTIGQFDNQPLIFYYNANEKSAYLGAFNINADLAPAVLKMLEQYPDAKKELNEKLAQSAKESELFK